VSTQTHPINCTRDGNCCWKDGLDYIGTKCVLEGLALLVKANGQDREDCMATIGHRLVDFWYNKSKMLGDLSNQNVSKLVSLSKFGCLDAFEFLENRQRFRQPCFPPQRQRKKFKHQAMLQISKE
jgi:hypothetical protein